MRETSIPGSGACDDQQGIPKIGAERIIPYQQAERSAFRKRRTRARHWGVRGVVNGRETHCYGRLTPMPRLADRATIIII